MFLLRAFRYTSIAKTSFMFSSLLLLLSGIRLSLQPGSMFKDIHNPYLGLVPV